MRDRARLSCAQAFYLLGLVNDIMVVEAQTSNFCFASHFYQFISQLVTFIMKKIILSLLAPLAIFSFAVVFGVSKAEAQVATSSCPTGYTCSTNLPLTVSIIGTPVVQINGFTSTGAVQSTSTLSKTYNLSLQAGNSDVYVDCSNSTKSSFAISSSSVIVIKDGAPDSNSNYQIMALCSYQSGGLYYDNSSFRIPAHGTSTLDITYQLPISSWLVGHALDLNLIGMTYRLAGNLQTYQYAKIPTYGATVSLDSASPLAATIPVTDTINGQYLKLPLLTFDLKATNSSEILTNLTANVWSPIGGSSGSITAAYLFQGSTQIQSASVVNGVAKFSNISAGTIKTSIPANTSVPFTIKADITNVGTTGGGFVVNASVDGSQVTLFNGTVSAQANGSATGYNITVVNGTTAGSLLIYPSKVSVASGATTTLSFTTHSNKVSSSLYLYCPSGVTTMWSVGNGMNLCNRYADILGSTTASNVSFIVKNSTLASQKLVANFYEYLPDRPNYAIGVVSDITVGPGTFSTSTPVCPAGYVCQSNGTSTPGVVGTIALSQSGSLYGAYNGVTFNLQAGASDMQVTSLKADFNVRPWLYFSTFSLVNPTTRQVIVPPTSLTNSNFTEIVSGSDYRYVFNGLNLVVPHGQTVSVVLTGHELPVTSQNAIVTYSSVNAVDGAGITHISTTNGTTTPPVTSGCYTFNTNLDVGSTGPDVVALQTLLIANGYDIPSVTSGRSAKGYFDNDTKSAVIAYQTAKGIPATGFVGPLTRYALNNCVVTAVSPYISSLSQSVATPGTKVTVYGSNFSTKVQNSVSLSNATHDTGVVGNTSSDGKSVSFTVASLSTISAGIYNLAIENSLGQRSNSLSFTIIAAPVVPVYTVNPVTSTTPTPVRSSVPTVSSVSAVVASPVVTASPVYSVMPSATAVASPSATVTASPSVTAKPLTSSVASTPSVTPTPVVTVAPKASATPSATSAAAESSDNYNFMASVWNALWSAVTGYK